MEVRAGSQFEPCPLHVAGVPFRLAIAAARKVRKLRSPHRRDRQWNYSMKLEFICLQRRPPNILSDRMRRLAAARARVPSCRSDEEARMRVSLMSRLVVAAAPGGFAGGSRCGARRRPRHSGHDAAGGIADSPRTSCRRCSEARIPISTSLTTSIGPTA